MNSIRTNNPSLKYASFTPLGCKDIAIWKFKLVVKTKFIYSVTYICI